MNEAPQDREPFYVGYLPFPKDLMPLVIGVAASLFVAGGAVALMLTTGSPSPGNGVWEEQTQSLSGRVVVDPYPVLLASNRGDGHPGPVLIVLSGKHGAGDAVLNLAGKGATLRGTVLRRQGYFMLELSEEEGAVTEAALPTATPDAAHAALGHRVLQGEIVDSKCYLGAMKPGTGKTHKDCATLCVRGGIPPVMLAMESDGTVSHYLVVNPEGGPMDEGLMPLIGDPITLSGEAEIRSGLPMVRVSLSQASRR